MEGLKKKAMSKTIKKSVLVTYHSMDLFRTIFRDFCATFELLQRSLAPDKNRDMVFQAGEGAGRSGSFFFFSHDRRFIIKTMKKEEMKCFLKRLHHFGDHFLKNRHSILARIYGVFTVKS